MGRLFVEVDDVTAEKNTWREQLAAVHFHGAKVATRHRPTVEWKSARVPIATYNGYYKLTKVTGYEWIRQEDPIIRSSRRHMYFPQSLPVGPLERVAAYLPLHHHLLPTFTFYAACLAPHLPLSA